VSSGSTADLIDTAAAGPAAMRGGLLRTSAYAGGLLLSLLSAPLLVRHLGSADFGRYSAVLAIVAIVTGLVDGGVNTVALRELSATADRAERDRLMRDLLGLRLALSLLGVALAVGFAAVAGYGPDLVFGTLLAGAGMVIAGAQTLLATALQSRLRFGWAAFIELLRQLVNTGLIVVLVLTGAGVISFLAVAIPASLAALALTVWQVHGMVSLRPAFRPGHWAPLLRDTVVFAVAVAVNTLYFRVALVVMSIVATDTETGEFAISYRVIEVLIGVPALLIGAAFPIVARTAGTDRARFEYTSGRLFELGVLVGCLAALSLTLGAPFAVEILTGSSDHPSVEVLQVQSIALLGAFVAAATGFPLLGLRRNRETLLANCAALLVVLVLAPALIPALGAVGAAAAAVAADLTLAAANTAMLRRRGGPPLPFSILPVAAVATGLGYGAGVLVGIHPVVQAAAGAAVFLAAVAAARRFPPELRDLLAHRTLG
jgi:O-antigen/teichoic acid export membrane protein